MNVRSLASLANRSMQNAFAYRMSYFLTFASNVIGFIALYALWEAIYDGREQLAGMSWDQMKAYLLITFMANSLLSWYSESAIANKVLDGSVAADLLKPLDFQKARLAETIGSTAVEGGITVIILCVIAATLSGIPVPHSLETWALFLFSLFGSFAVKFGVVYIAGLLCFWSTGSFGIIWSRIAITNLLSGATIPLTFFPGWLEKLALYLPFQGIVYTPASIYMGYVDSKEALQWIALQWAWAIGLWFAGKGIWSWAVRKITIHGG
ncbi:ABC transporter permease [Cohnella suwonensis]|uniref:ABC transporter permease n=1 Tax=Cohnella suwonensis TaxID=696072 RepID=A0ABW0LRN2_9BACL